MTFHHYLGHLPDAIQHTHKHIKRVSPASVPMLTWVKARAHSSPQGVLQDVKLKDAPPSLSNTEEAVLLAGMEGQTGGTCLLPYKHRQKHWQVPWS